MSWRSKTGTAIALVAWVAVVISVVCFVYAFRGSLYLWMTVVMPICMLLLLVAVLGWLLALGVGTVSAALLYMGLTRLGIAGRSAPWMMRRS